MNRLVSIFIVFAFILITGCGEDDGPFDGVVGVPPAPPRLLSEVIVEDDTEITTYLETHFYNYEEFETPPANFDFRIRIDTIEGDNSDKRPLVEDIITETISISSEDIGIEDDEGEINHTLYYLVAREGVGETPTIADSTFVRIEGRNLEGGVFQDFNSQPVWFDLPSTVRGFSLGVSKFIAGGEVIINDDGTFTVRDYGVGLVIMPSALGFFNNNTDDNLPPYTPALFTIDLFTSVVDTDHDGDGIPSIQEDLDRDGNLRNDNTDGDAIPGLGFLFNYLDPDDDNDGILTRDEIEIDAQGNITFPDSDNDGTPDYLDSDS